MIYVFPYNYNYETLPVARRTKVGTISVIIRKKSFLKLCDISRSYTDAINNDFI